MRPALDAVHEQAISISPVFILPALPPTRHHPYGRGATPSCETLWKTRGAVLTRVFAIGKLNVDRGQGGELFAESAEFPYAGRLVFLAIPISIHRLTPPNLGP